MPDVRDFTTFAARLAALPFLPSKKRDEALAAAASTDPSARQAAWENLERVERRLAEDPAVRQKLKRVLATSHGKAAEIGAREKKAALYRAESADRQSEENPSDLLAGL